MRSKRAAAQRMGALMALVTIAYSGPKGTEAATAVGVSHRDVAARQALLANIGRSRDSLRFSRQPLVLANDRRDESTAFRSAILGGKHRYAS